MWQLTREDDLVEILPRGGLLARWRSSGVDVLKTQPHSGDYLEGLPLWGCFPMAPFCNRLTPTVLPAHPDAIRFNANWPLEGLALHGTVYDAEWHAAKATGTHLEIACTVRAADRSDIGLCTKSIELTEAGLRLSIAFRYGLEGTMLAGVGLHPWFNAPACVQFRAAHRLDYSDDMVHCTAVPTEHIVLSSAEDDGHDCCYAGLGGPILLRADAWPDDLQITTNAPCAHVFLSNDFQSVCVEPVSHAPNAAHNEVSAAQGPLRQVSQGDSVAIDMSMGWASKACRDAA